MPKFIQFKFLQILFAILVLAISGCTCLKTQDNGSTFTASEDLFYIESPKELIQNGKKFFKHEWQVINQRRGDPYSNDKQPAGTIGLAFSEGGIRSNAFQLGILSGLYENGLLPKIDYISTVSGGSWAAAAYLFSKKTDEQFFNKLNLFESVHLLTEQKEIYREKWRDRIVKDVLSKNDCIYKDLDRSVEIKDCSAEIKCNLDKRPYFIINATHSAEPTEFPKDYNFNIQFTRDAIIVPADCNSEMNGDKPCNLLQQISWGLPTAGGFGKGFMARNNKNSDYLFYVNTFPFPWMYIQKLRVSDIISASSAVFTKLYGNWLKIKTKGNVLEPGGDDNMRDKYRLSDGGKSENLGALALIERGVDLVIISQMAEDVMVNFSDLELLNSQLKNLFGLAVDGGPIKKDIKCKNRLYSISRYGKLECEDYITEKESIGEVIYIKPTYRNISDFTGWLQNESILNALKKDIEDNEKYIEGTMKNLKDILCHKSRFPQNPTLCPEYEKDIIHAYYLLGKYVIEKTTDIKDKIMEVSRLQ